VLRLKDRSVWVAAPERRAVRCTRCGHAFGVGPRAVTGSCPSCHAPAIVDPVRISSPRWAGRAEACAQIEVQKRSRVTHCALIAGMDITVAGSVEGDLVSGGTVRVLEGGRVRGLIRAAGFEIEGDGVIEGVRFEIFPDGAGALRGYDSTLEAPRIA